MRHAKEYRRGSRGKAAVFFTILILVMIFSLILPLRPRESKLEKRELAGFPEFSVETLLNGEYFQGIDTWFSDTFPARDLFFQINEGIRSLYGARSEVTIHGQVEQGDEIPDAPFTGS